MYSLRLPSQIVFGPGCSSQLPELLESLGGNRPLVICSRVIFLGDKEELSKFCGKTPVDVICGIPHDPDLETVNMVLRKAISAKADSVLAIGGGSVIDVAKAVAVLAPVGDDVTDFFRRKRAISGRGLPLIAVPTTAGTGAEMTKNSVFIDRDRCIKTSMRSPHMIPDVALIDPDLTLTCSPKITAACGLDAFTQAVECYTSTEANTFSSILSLRAAGMIFRNLPIAYTQPMNREARSELAEASMLTGMAFANAGLGAVHGLAHPIGNLLGLPHGYTCAVLLPHILWANYCDCEGHYLRLAEACGCGLEGFVESVQHLCLYLGFPRTFADDGLNKSHFSNIISTCRSGSMLSNPRVMEDSEIIDILEQLLC